MGRLTTTIFLLLVAAIASSVQAASNSSEEESWEVSAKFKPSRLSFKINSGKLVNVSLRGLPDQKFEAFSAYNASLRLLNAGGDEGAVAFSFDDSWDAEVYVTSAVPGRFIYYVQLNNGSPVVQGSLTVHVYRKRAAEIFSVIIGWVNFVLWSVSFYPQIILNHTRKSVVGLSFDFTLINVAGFLPFAIFNCLLYFPGRVQSEYFQRNPHEPIPVELNDVVFAVHATVLCALTALQCFIFERGDQRVTKYGYTFLFGDLGAILLSAILHAVGVVNLLHFVNVLSYVKLASTLFKYIPQVYFNYRRKSTVGWSIGAIILDTVGGLCSFLQQCVIALNYDSWVVIYGNVVKFLLALASLFFDFIFVLQHYVLYRNVSKKPPK